MSLEGHREVNRVRLLEVADRSFDPFGIPWDGLGQDEGATRGMRFDI